MKMISLAIDYTFFEKSSTSNTNESIIYPTTSEFFSYILSIHNTIFGPWTNYRNYIRHFHENNPARKIDFFELAKWAYYCFRVGFCLVVSTCLTDWFLQNRFMYNNEQDNNRSGWCLAYIQALSYRFSHYCVCFTGELCGQVSGLEFHDNEYRNYSNICQQAKQRIDAERKAREQTEPEAILTDFYAGKRKQKIKKYGIKQEEQDSVHSMVVEEYHDFNLIR